MQLFSRATAVRTSAKERSRSSGDVADELSVARGRPACRRAESMRIVQYYPRAAIGDGGMTGAVKRLAKALTEAGADAAIAYDDLAPPPPVRNGTSWLPVRHHGPATQRIARERDLREAFRGADMVVLNSGFAPHNAFAARVARRSRVAYVVAPRGAYDPHIFTRRPTAKRAWWRMVEFPMVQRAHAVHLFFDEETADLRRLGYVGPILFAPNGVEPPPDVRWDGGTGGYVLWLGRFDPQHKGIDLLVRAVARLSPGERPQLRLVGPEWRGGRQRIASLIRELALERWVSVEPAKYGHEKWQLLASANCFVYPSRWEGFGNSAAEAAALGVPLIVTPYPLGRLLARRGGARLVPATVEGLASGLRSGTDTASLGMKAREIVLGEMSWDQIGRSWLKQAHALL